jgi:uncharacterized protein Veg
MFDAVAHEGATIQHARNRGRSKQSRRVVMIPVVVVVVAL